MISRARRRWLRQNPRPEQPPDGYTTWDHPDRPGEVIYVPAEEVQLACAERMWDYDKMPKRQRDALKEKGLTS